MKHWLVKEEPRKYSFADLQRDGKTVWTGVRNYQARNNLREMAKGDEVVYYHSGKERAAVGLAEVAKSAFPDPTAKEGDWSSVELRAVRALTEPVPLSAAKEDRVLAETALVKQSRLSVVPLTAAQYKRFLKLGGERAAAR